MPSYPGFAGASVQWPFQEPKLEMPTMYEAYFLGLCFREYTKKDGQKFGTNVAPFCDPEDLPLNYGLW